MKHLKKLKAFTLVELIIVITILAILATIAFVSFQNYTKDARDSNRLATLKNIENGLNTFSLGVGNYPEPDGKVTISLSGTKVSYQGEIGKNVTSLIKLSEIPKDPQNNLPYYYATSDTGKGYKVLSYLENNQANITLQTYAASNTPIVKGIGPAILADSENNIIKNDVDLFGTQSGTLYKVLVDNTIQSSGSGIDIGGGFQMMAIKGGDFSAPKSCPDGFIPVPGNQEFLQPGFCVAKYEMSLERNLGLGEISTGRNTWIGSINSQSISENWVDGKIVSKPERLPIANITIYQAIGACNSIGGHVITNNERMTIARNIEANQDNWKTGIVGSGGIYRGLTNESNTNISSLGCNTIDSIGIGSELEIKAALSEDTKKWGNQKMLDCDSKRQLKLNNGEIIWDLSGNVQEHVNAVNTIDAKGFNKKNTNTCANVSGWISYNGDPVNDPYDTCVFINGYTYQNMGPKLPGLNISNGVGRIYSGSGQTIVRGGTAGSGKLSGIYSLDTNNNPILLKNSQTGFRCAY